MQMGQTAQIRPVFRSDLSSPITRSDCVVTAFVSTDKFGVLWVRSEAQQIHLTS